MSDIIKTTIALSDKQIFWLDQLASNIRLNTKNVITRTEIIRSMLSAIEQSDLDFKHVKSPLEFENMILKRLKGE